LQLVSLKNYYESSQLSNPEIWRELPLQGVTRVTATKN